ncbi:MAG: hypothetical protein K2H17_01825 [Duncaniella sp.]|uniref:cell division protein FtsQ/DivIB n=1 Tax=Duncaniella sp. TaxID=2518496 RepID=UPI0023CC698E|nr:hypothetical protein [Duncaniella sp.]MDE5988115.1 hypothetical protein [Duncaniella sp.]
MSRYLTIISSLLLVAYLVIALTVTANEADMEPCRGMEITIAGTDGNRHFVTAAELSRELDSLPDKAAGMALGNINTQQIRRRLIEMDKIEDAEVVRYTDGTIRITATPIIPVARIFDEGESYYINRAGKRVKADARFHKDVPVIEGHFDPSDSVFTPESLLPLLNYISNDSVWNSYISMIKVKSPRDIILVPVIREHVINFGAPAHFDDKFSRLKKFYSKVLPLQGWEKYDTLSLKWKGQLVATKRRRAPQKVETVQYDDDESVDTGTMLAGDDVAPGQTIPGMEAHNEKPIPAARKTPQENSAAKKTEPKTEKIN